MKTRMSIQKDRQRKQEGIRFPSPDKVCRSWAADDANYKVAVAVNCNAVVAFEVVGVAALHILPMQREYP